MSTLDIVQLAGSIISLVLTVGATLVLAMITYMIRRRDKEIDSLALEMKEVARTHVTHSVEIERLSGKVNAVERIEKDVREIRDNVNELKVTLAKNS